MKLTVRDWGALPDGQQAHLITISADNGTAVTLSDYGAIVQSIMTRDRNGMPDDIVLGYDTLEEYVQDELFFGACAGRYANRIAGARLSLNGEVWPLTENENGNILHGGVGFHKKLWELENDGGSVLLRRVSAHLEDGFPGELETQVRVTLDAEGRLRFEYTARSSRDTVCSLTNHSYFNLTGMGAVGGHILQVNASQMTPVDAQLLPTGEIAPVDGTDYDFRAPRNVGLAGLDCNLVLDGGEKPAAVLTEQSTGRRMELWTDLPGLQLYNGGGIKPRIGKGNMHYRAHSGVCLEPQHFPDAMHHENFPSPVLRAGEVYSRYIEYRFSLTEH